MAGIKFETGIRASSGPGTSQTAGTASEAAFGPGYSGSQQSAASALTPNDPASWALWGGVAAFGGLWLVYRSLPSGRRAEMELVLITLALWGPVKGLARMSLQRLAQDNRTQGWTDDLARAGIWVLS